MLHNRFSSALGLSLIVHLLVMAVPSGQGGILRASGNTSSGPGTHFASLNVMLAPYAMMSPRKSEETSKRVRRESHTAAAIETLASGNGTLKNSGSSATMPEHSTPTAPGIVAPHYYPPDELTKRASILRDVDPYLGKLENVPGFGKAILVLKINELGGVDHVEISDSTLAKPFEDAVVEGFMATQFMPAERDGTAVKSQMRVEIDILPRARRPFD